MDKLAQTQTITTLFGGTFDPPHFGHLIPLQEVADMLQLPTVSLLPANVPVFKKNATPAEHRVAMTRLLCQLDQRFEIDLTEVQRTAVSYTIDTLTHLKQQNPNQVIVFIIGLDALLSIYTWERWQELFDYCHLIVMMRPLENSSPRPEPKKQPAKEKLASNLYNFYTSSQQFDTIVGTQIPETAKQFLASRLARTENTSECINQQAFQDIIRNCPIGKLWFINNQVLPLSSSYIRQQLNAGKKISEWVPASICDYINEHQLYTK